MSEAVPHTTVVFSQRLVEVLSQGLDRERGDVEQKTSLKSRSNWNMLLKTSAPEVPR